MLKNVSYEAYLRCILRVKVRLIIYDKEAGLNNKVVKDIKEQEVYMGEMPLMTRHRYLRYQWYRTRYCLADASFARCVL